MPVEELSESEIATLNYVREEEFLAHDEIINSPWEGGNGFCICNTGVSGTRDDLRTE